MTAENKLAGVRGAWGVTLAAAAILMVTRGARQSLGLFVSPLNSSTGLGITTISFALAVGQLVWGAIQPVAGAVADRYGPGKVLVAGLIVLSLGTALTPFMTSGFGLVVALGVLAAIGAGAGSFSVLVGAAARHLTEDRRGKAAGIINAGGSFGQFVFAPISQALIQALGWMGAMWSLALITLGALPLAMGTGTGSELRRPLGVTIIGGLIMSQALTLFTTPVVYLYFDRLQHYWDRVRGRMKRKVVPVN